jgi:hypothetical protein
MLTGDIIKMISNKQDARVLTAFNWLCIGSSDKRNEISAPINGVGFIALLRNQQLLNGSASWS